MARYIALFKHVCICLPLINQSGISLLEQITIFMHICKECFQLTTLWGIRLLSSSSLIASLFFLNTVELQVIATQNFMHDLHSRNITEVVQRIISLIVPNEFVCPAENKSIPVIFSMLLVYRSSCIICMYIFKNTSKSGLPNKSGEDWNFKKAYDSVKQTNK